MVQLFQHHNYEIAQAAIYYIDTLIFGPVAI